MNNKKCSKCDEIKSYNEFTKVSKNSERLRPSCNKCMKIYKKEYSEKNENKKVIIPEFKTCNRCKESKKNSEFHKCMQNKDHLSYMCKCCNRGLKSLNRKNNRSRDDIKLPKQKKCGVCNKTKKAEMFCKSKRESDGLNYMCKECASKRRQEWENNNRDKVREKCRKRRAMRHKVDEDYTTEQKNITMQIFGERCFNCGSENDICIDHVYPLSDNHALSPSNACPLCKSCNSSKGAKDPIIFYDNDKFIELQEKLYSALMVYHRDVFGV